MLLALFSFLGGLSDKYRGTLTGLAASLFGIGIFSGPLVVAQILIFTGKWETAFWALAVAGIVGAILIAYGQKIKLQKRRGIYLSSA